MAESFCLPCAHPCTGYARLLWKMLFVKAFTSHIIVELENAQFIKNKYPFVIA